ncbi:MAG TPA: phosphotransferase [Candidatus Binatia bacterium]|jgi:hypothetical protein|nr:phosphotransferase [Candidatus Binatia bacterium]
MTLPHRQGDEEVLRRCLDEIVDNVASGRTAITSVHRIPSGYSSWYASDIVTIELANGAELKVFLKDYGSYSCPKDGMEQRRDREMRVYRDLLAEANLGTARYYGSVSDASQGRFWLLLEFVEGMPVRYCDLEYWISAAGWLGRMQGRFARQLSRLSATGFLIRHDADFFWSKAELAQTALSETPLAGRLMRLLRGYDRAVGAMASQPRTLVHGAYRPKEILLNLNTNPPRICPVDWELAGLGSPIYDLALFADGFESSVQDRLWGVYREQAQGCGLSLPEREEASYLMDCFRLHHVMNWLGQSRTRGFPEAKVARLVDLGEQLRSRIL